MAFVSHLKPIPRSPQSLQKYDVDTLETAYSSNTFQTPIYWHSV